MNPDVVVIGAGIVGCSCAYYLSREGLRVHLVERGSVGSGASKAGMMHVVTWEEPEAHLRLAKASKLLYEALSEELPFDINYRPSGSIAIVETPEGMDSFGETIRRLQAWGLNCSLLSAQELIEMEPNISRDIGGGAFFAEDAQVNPLYATPALAYAAQSCGATLSPFTEVTGFELSAGGDAVQAVLTTGGRIPTGAAVIAAGAWSGEVGKLAGLDIPVRPRKGTLVVTVPVPDDLLNCKVVLAAGYMDSVRSGAESGVAVAANVQQAKNGNLVLGSSRQFVGFDNRVDPLVVALMLKRCLRFFPALADVTAIRTWAGFRPYTPDLLPIISPVERIAGLYIAAGHEGIGITEGPVTGKIISQLVAGQEPDIPLEQLSFSRFAS